MAEIIILILLIIISLLIAGIIDREKDLPQAFIENRQRGYDEAVDDIVIRHQYWNRKEHCWKKK